MKLKKLEIIALVFLLSAIVSMRLDEDFARGFKVLISLILFMFFAIGGYFIFKPSNEVKFGLAFSIINGISLGFAYFFILQVITFSTFNKDSPIWTFFIFLLSFMIIPLVVLILANRRLSQNKMYLKFVISRNIFPLVIVSVLLFLPDKVRVLTFFGSESMKYYMVMQKELIEQARLENDSGKSDLAINSCLSSINYSKRRNDTSEYLFQSSLNYLGYSYYMNGQNLKADSVLQKALRLSSSPEIGSNGEKASSNYYLGLNYSSLGDYTKSDSLLFLSFNTRHDIDFHAYLYRCIGNNSNKRAHFLGQTLYLRLLY